jgi:PAS domain S-box-containing protein
MAHNAHQKNIRMLPLALLSEIFRSLAPEGRPMRLLFQTMAFVSCGLFTSEVLRSRRLIHQTQQRLRALVETSPAAIVAVSQSGTVEIANQAATDLMLSGEGDLLGKPIGTFIPELENALSSGKGSQFRTSMQCQARRSNGEILFAQVWFSTYREKGAQKMAAIIADITDEYAVETSAPVSEPARLERPGLNSRQTAVLRLVFEGFTNDQIACRLGMTKSAVKNVLQQLFSKAGAHNRGQLVRFVLERYRDFL